MDDIVERLRHWSHGLTYDPAAGLMHEAAAEIERLRTRATHNTPRECSGPSEGRETVGERLVERLSTTKSLLDDNEKLRAEIARLRGDTEVARLRMEAAHGEIERLRNGVAAGRETVCPHVRGTVTQHCSLNFTLADEEREAIEWAVCEADVENSDTLRNLLERLRT